MSEFRVIPLLGVVVGLLTIAVAVGIVLRRRRFVRRAVRVPGVIVDHSYDGEGAHLPVLEFRTLDGRSVRTTSRWSRRPSRMPRGLAVTVLYDPRDPARASLPDDSPGCAFAILLFIGVGFAVMGSVLLLFFAALPPLR